MKDRQKTNVIFRKWKDDGQIIALFPHEDWNLEGNECASYMHIGQHSGCEYQFVLMQTVPATREEYDELYSELAHIGYNLQVFMGEQMIRYCKNHFGYDDQTIMDMLIAFKDMEYTNDETGRKLTYRSALHKVGLTAFLAAFERATYHCTSTASFDWLNGKSYNISFRNTGWGK